MKCQVLFSLKNNERVLFSPKKNEKVFMNVVFRSHDWHFKN